MFATRPRLGLVLLVGMILPLASEAQTPPFLHGVVADEETSQLLPTATVTLVEQGLEAQSGTEGTFEFADLPVGPVLVQVSAPGYRTVLEEVEITADRVVYLQILLSRVQGEAALRARVVDGASGEPITGARVSLPELDRSALTNARGEASLPRLPAGEHLLEVTMLGYGSAEGWVGFEPASEVEAEIQLGTQPIEVEGITVTGVSTWSANLERGGYYRRARMGLGRHLDRAAIEEWNPFDTLDLFRRLPGVQVQGQGGGDSRLYSGRRTGVGAFTQGDCPMTVYVNGVRWQEGGIEDLPVDWVEGVEIYTGVSQVPAEYSGVGAACGVVLIWTG